MVPNATAVGVVFGPGKYGWLSAFSESNLSSMVLPPTCVFLMSDRSTLLTLSVRTFSSRSGNVRTFDPSCCVDTLLKPASVLNQRATVCSLAGSAMSSRSPVKMMLPKPIGKPLW